MNLCLAQASTNDVITWVIIIVLIFGGAIFNWIKQQVDKNKSAEQGSRKRGGKRESLEEMTARRREQLQDLAQRRQQGGDEAASGAQRSGGAEPNPANMTMAERIARARAKQQYEQRRGEGAGKVPSPKPAAAPRRRESSGDDDGRQDRQRHAEHQAAEAKVRTDALAQQRASELEQAREDARRRRQSQPNASGGSGSTTSGKSRPASRPPQGQRPAPTRKVPPPRVVAAPVDDHRVAVPVEATQAEVGVTEIGIAGAGTVRQRGTGKRLVNVGKLSRGDLQRIVVLKEIFDKPVALRNPAEGAR